MSDQEPDPNNSTKTRMFVLSGVLGSILVLLVAGLILLGMGQVSGVEFSPDDFSRRSFTYNQMPWTGWVVFNKQYEDETGDLARSLVSTRLMRSVVLKKKRWHLISESGSSVISHQCDARFLTGYLDRLDEDGVNYWDTWNTDFPKCAKVFWPEIAELARDEMYLKIADVMQVAMNISKDKPKPFKRQLNSVLSDVYLELGTLDNDLGKLKRAQHRLKQSIAHDTNSANSEASKKLKSLERQIGSSTPEALDTEATE